MFYYYDPTFIILIPAIIISSIAQGMISRTYRKYSNYISEKNISGAEAARKILDNNGLNHIRIEKTQGKLTDHYDPAKKVLRLSDQVYSGTSISSCGIAAHEAGHAIQHNRRYAPLVIRNTLVPVVNFSSRFVWILVIAGLLLGYYNLVQTGILLFSGIVIFQLITLPVEFNASSRALSQLKEAGVLSYDEISNARKVLNAAAFTYVAAAFVAVSQLIRLISIFNSRRD